MKRSTANRAKGLMRVVKGAMMGILARMSANRALGAKGKLEKFTGTVQCNIGKAQGIIGL